MLEIKELEVSYIEGNKKSPALGPVSLAIKEGEIMVVIGPSGCGKSTLVQCLAGIVPNDAGKILLNGRPISYKRDAIGYMPQGYGLLPWKTVYQNCLLPYRVRKAAFTDDNRLYLEHLLSVLGLTAFKDRYPIALSGGQRQRAALARTLGLRPQLLLMDEPFSALDAMMKEEAQEAFMRLWQEVHCTALVVTHSIEEALYLGKKIVVLGHHPGTIISVRENPWFGKKAAYEDAKYRKMDAELRQDIKRGWNHESY